MGTGLTGSAGSDLTGQGFRFVLVGSLATVIQLGLYAFLSGSVGAELANIVAWLLSTMVGNAAHHRYTFQVAGASTESDHLVGLLTGLAGLGISTWTLDVLNQPTGLSGTIALVAVNSVVGVLRFVALRLWAGRAHPVKAVRAPVMAAAQVW